MNHEKGVSTSVNRETLNNLFLVIAFQLAPEYEDWIAPTVNTFVVTVLLVIIMFVTSNFLAEIQNLNKQNVPFIVTGLFNTIDAFSIAVRQFATVFAGLYIKKFLHQYTLTLETTTVIIICLIVDKQYLSSAPYDPSSK